MIRCGSAGELPTVRQITSKDRQVPIKISEQSKEPAMDHLTRRHGPDAMTRRSALLALSSTMLSSGLMAQPTRPVIQTRRLNNVMIAVSNLERSEAFYERLFGPPVRQGDTVVFRTG